jgi:mannose-1-phosphate guanylyltransferase/mannose-6-phosphate isomerase
MTHQIVPVVMCGGAGTRLWPLSVNSHPKPFHVMGGGMETLFQATVNRLRGHLEGADSPGIICGAAHVDLVESQLKEIGVKPRWIISEPVGRNTAAVAALTALMADADGAQVALLLPADHIIKNPAAFCEAVKTGLQATSTHIVTFGAKAAENNIGYGYIQTGDELAAGVRACAAFKEKPDAQTAQTYVDAGDYVWNTGMFLFSPKVMLREFEAHRPDILLACRSVLHTAGRHGVLHELPLATFATVPEISIDHAVMEPSTHVAVVPCDMGWADVGCWSELWKLAPKDAEGNYVHGRAHLHNVHNSVIRTDGTPVSVIGLDDIVVVATRDGVLVTPKAHDQDVKKVVHKD